MAHTYPTLLFLHEAFTLSVDRHATLSTRALVKDFSPESYLFEGAGLDLLLALILASA